MEQNVIQKREAQTPQGVEWASARKVFMPRTDICDKADEIIVMADMPGVDEASADVTLENGVLTINGKVKECACKDHVMHSQEYEIGDYQRAFTLSDEVDQNGIQAVVKNGVLTLRLPKVPRARARKITVKAE
jgi:HSP20 family molecular chaperone IbpA